MLQPSLLCSASSSLIYAIGNTELDLYKMSHTAFIDLSKAPVELVCFCDSAPDGRALQRYPSLIGPREGPEKRRVRPKPPRGQGAKFGRATSRLPASRRRRLSPAHHHRTSLSCMGGDRKASKSAGEGNAVRTQHATYSRCRKMPVGEARH